jgi:hypothetical protein
MIGYIAVAVLATALLAVLLRFFYVAGKEHGKGDGIELCQKNHRNQLDPVECLHSWDPWKPLTLKKWVGERVIKYDALQRTCTGCGDVERKAVSDSGALCREQVSTAKALIDQATAIEARRKRAVANRGAR